MFFSTANHLPSPVQGVTVDEVSWTCIASPGKKDWLHFFSEPFFGSILTQNALSKSKASITSDSAMRCGRSWIIASATERIRMEIQDFVKNCKQTSKQVPSLIFYIFLIKCSYTTFVIHSYFHIPQFNFDFLTKHSSKANRIPRLLTSSMIWLSSSLSTDSIWLDQCIQIPHTSQTCFQTIHQVWSESALVCEQTSLVCLTSLCARHWSAPRRSACGPTFGHKIKYKHKSQHKTGATSFEHESNMLLRRKLKPVDIEQNVARGKIMGRVQKLGDKENVDWSADRPLPLSPNQSWRPLRCHQCIHPEIAIHKAKTCGDWSLQTHQVVIPFNQFVIEDFLYLCNLHFAHFCTILYAMDLRSPPHRHQWKCSSPHFAYLADTQNTQNTQNTLVDPWFWTKFVKASTKTGHLLCIEAVNGIEAWPCTKGRNFWVSAYGKGFVENLRWLQWLQYDISLKNQNSKKKQRFCVCYKEFGGVNAGRSSRLEIRFQRSNAGYKMNTCSMQIKREIDTDWC